MSKYSLNSEGNIIGGLPMPQFVYDKLTDEEVVELRRLLADRFDMGVWYGKNRK